MEFIYTTHYKVIYLYGYERGYNLKQIYVEPI